MILSPAAYAEARRLLGLPDDAVLTIAQVYEAASIEVRSAAIRRAFANNGVQSTLTAGQRRALESKPKE